MKINENIFEIIDDRKFFFFTGLDESVKIVESMGGWCRGQIVDISRREEVYKAAAEIKNNFGDVSKIITSM